MANVHNDARKSVGPETFYPSPRTEARRSLDAESLIEYIPQNEEITPPVSQAEILTNTTAIPPLSDISTAPPSVDESLITESEAEPIVIEGQNGGSIRTGASSGAPDEGAEDDEDEMDLPQVGLPLPAEHIYVQDPRQPLMLSDFQVLKTLGTGTFGRVLLVRLTPDSRHHRPDAVQYFAMKVLAKSEVVRLKQVKHANAERNILARISHPFIVDLYATFQDHLNVYMLLSYVPGGELFSHLRSAGRFTPDVARFYLGCIALALRYLHAHNIIYRDLKPENLLLDYRGYLRIADFGFAKVVDDRTWTLCGTPEYLAPEIIEQKGHSKAVDWWAFGVLAYEMLVGYPPFFDENPVNIYQKIVRGHAYWPDELDQGSQTFIKGFLKQDRSKRMGNLRGGADDVLRHPWFSGVDWMALENGEIDAPLIPRIMSPTDTANFANLPMPRPQDIPGLLPQYMMPPDQRDDPFGWQFLDF